MSRHNKSISGAFCPLYLRKKSNLAAKNTKCSIKVIKFFFLLPTAWPLAHYPSQLFIHTNVCNRHSYHFIMVSKRKCDHLHPSFVCIHNIVCNEYSYNFILTSQRKKPLSHQNLSLKGSILTQNSDLCHNWPQLDHFITTHHTLVHMILFKINITIMH